MMADMNQILRNRFEEIAEENQARIDEELQLAAEHRKEKARRTYLAAGGSEDGFTKQWPEIRARILADKTVEAMKSRR